MARVDWELDQGYFLPVLVLWQPRSPGIAGLSGRQVLQFVQLYTDTDDVILNMAMGVGVGGCIFQSNWRRLVIRVLCFLLPS